MKSIKLFLKNYMRQYIPMLILGFTFIMCYLLKGDAILRPMNITNVFFQNSYILVLAIGMVMVIQSGKIDL